MKELATKTIRGIKTLGTIIIVADTIITGYRLMCLAKSHLAKQSVKNDVPANEGEQSK